MDKHLPELHHGPAIEELPPLSPRFFIPRLIDKPQNPIMDSLHLSQYLKRNPRPTAKDIITVGTPTSYPPKQSPLVWSTLSGANDSSKTNLRSWDTFRPPYSSNANPSPYLSEQNSTVFAAARHHARPLLSDGTTEVLYVDQQDLLPSLRLLLTGTSSALHLWDPINECFTLRTKHGNRGVVVVIGKDEIITSSFLSRFLTIGTISRRLEIYASRINDSDAEPTMYAFAHALSSILTMIRVMLMESNHVPEYDITALWVSCGESEEILMAIAKLCHREEGTSPANYPGFPSSTKVLSDIYTHCALHLEKSSPRTVAATFAFILTITSEDYFQQLRSSLSVGYSTVVVQEQSARINPFTSAEGDRPVPFKVPKQEHPCFVSVELQRKVQNAQRSLRMLQAACPSHPVLLRSPRNLASLGWFWTAQDIEDAWERKERSCRTETHTQLQPPSTPHRTIYKPELADFQVFDYDPAITLNGASSMIQIQKFITTFPASLPPLTPTIDILTSLVLSPLAEHAATLSGALLDIFMSRPISGSPRVDLDLHSHLTLLRSFLLLCSHLFKSKLSYALFSDSEQYVWESRSGDARSLALTSAPPTDSGGKKPWPVGLASGLIERESWPPGGADLSFYLRTVIIDSMEVRMICNRRKGHAPTAFEEVDSRLGFAIRDLPTGKGRDRWLDPCSIEALDFLYMEYHPPAPLSTLISPEIVSKYQRIFAFNLRLTRVENVVRMLYRISRSRKTPLFSTSAPTNASFLHFRFLIQIFVTQFSSYIYDIAIRGHFDAFLYMLEGQDPQQFPDIFALAEYHSNVMDDVLTACLLRSGQRAAGDALRGCLETILELGVLAGELTRGRVQEYEAKPVLEELFKNFKEKMTRLIKVLKLLTEKATVGDPESSRMRRGGVHSILQLLVKLDSGWW